MANEKETKAGEKQAEKLAPKADVKLDTGVVSKAAVKPAPFIAALEARARELHRAGDYAGESVLLEVATAAGALKHKTAAALDRFGADPAIKGLHEIL